MRPIPLLLVLAACSGKSGPADSAGDDAAVTWYRDIGPMVADTCASCHGPDGVAGLDLTDPERAAELSGLMAAMVTSGLMPPPSADPACRPYQGSDRLTLDEEERALFQAWDDAGAPLGDPGDAPVSPAAVARIEDPDLVLTMPFAYTPDLDGDGNQYWCVTLENPVDQPVWITALDVDLGNPAVVHHMLLMKDLGGDAGQRYGVSDPSAGFDCRDPMMEDDWSILHAWAPGMEATTLLEGTGMEIAPGDQIVLQMHYFSSEEGTPDPDQSSYLLRLTTEAPADEIEVYPIGPDGFTIPAGAADHREEGTINNRYVDFTFYGVFPHLHLLGSHYRAWIEDDGVETDCLAEGDWDFHHQAFYMYDQPYVFETGTTLKGYCTWDNSADNPDQYNDPPQDIAYGEGTNQEMCYFLFYLSY